MFVVFVSEQELELQGGQAVFEGRHLARDFLLQIGIIRVEEFNQPDNVVGLRVEFVPEVDFILDAPVAAHDLAGAVGVVPEIGRGDLAVEFG